LESELLRDIFNDKLKDKKQNTDSNNENSASQYHISYTSNATNYEGKLLKRHTLTLFGHGYIWFQHVRKAGGTTLCDVMSRNFISTNRTGCWCKSYINANLLHSMEEVELFCMKHFGLDFVSFEAGGFPKYARSSLNDTKWVFMTSLRNPLDRIISHVHYSNDENKYFNSTFEAAKWLAGRDYSLRKRKLIYDCYYDNYYTRIFSSHCQSPDPMTETDFQLAATTLKRFDICFVMEWLSDMAPILKYTLGAGNLDMRPRNYFGVGPDFYHGRHRYIPTLSRAENAQNRHKSSDAELYLNDTEFMYLAEANKWDIQLYNLCKKSALTLANRWLFRDSDDET
jgi:hypothetical protein